MPCCSHCLSSDKESQEDLNEEDTVQLLDEAEALELVEFDPSVYQGHMGTPLSAMASFLQKHLNKSL